MTVKKTTMSLDSLYDDIAKRIEKEGAVVVEADDGSALLVKIPYLKYLIQEAEYEGKDLVSFFITSPSYALKCSYLLIKDGFAMVTAKAKIPEEQEKK